MSDSPQNRPYNRLDCNLSTLIFSAQDLTTRGDYGADPVIVVGQARPGASEDEPVWQIKQLTYDTSTPPNLLSTLWPQDANGIPSNDYQFTWSDRGSLTFS